MATLAKLVVELVGDIGGFVGDMDKAESKMSKFGSGMIKAGAGLTAGVTAPIVGMGVAVLAVGGQFDEAMDTIRTTTGATGSELTALGEDVKAVFGAIPTDMATAATAVSELNARTGQTGKGLQDLATAEIELARITGGELSSQIQNSTRMFGDWGIAVTDQVPALDVLLRAHQQTGIGVDSLAAKLVQFGAPLRQMGFDFETSAALIGKFEKEGVNTELVLGSLRIALGKMAKAGVEPKEGLRQLVDEIQKTGSAADANKLAIAAFGARAGPDMAAAIREGRFSIDELYDAIANGSDTVLGAAADTNDYAEQFTILKNKVTAAAIPLGVTLFGAINKSMPMVERLIGFISGLITKFSNLPSGVQTGIMAFVALVAALGPVLTTIGGIISVITGLGPALAAVGAVVGTALGPVLLIIAAIVAAVILFRAAWESNFLGIRDFIQNIVARIKEIIGAVVAWLNGEISFEQMTAKVKAAFAGLKETVGKTWETIKTKAGELWGATGQVIQNRIAEIKTGVVSKIEDIRAAAASKWESLRANAGEKWDAVKTRITTVVGGIKNFVIDTLGELVSAAAGLFGKILDAISGGGGKGAAPGDGAGLGTLLNVVQLKTTITQVVTALQGLRTTTAQIWATMQADIVTWWTLMQTTLFLISQMMGQTTVLNYQGILGGFRSLGQLLMREVAITWGIITATVITAAETMRSGAVGATTAMASEILGILNGLASSARSAGEAIGNGVADGIRNSIGAAVAAANELAAAVDAVLPHSDAKEGPLSHLTDSGRALPETLAQGMRLGADALQRTMASLTPAPAPVQAGDGRAPAQTINVTINNPQGQTAESDILRQLRNLAYVGVLNPAAG